MDKSTDKMEQSTLAAQWMTAEILTEILASSGPLDLANKLSEQLRELTGARTVLVLVHSDEAGGSLAYGACPERRAGLFSPAELVAFCPDRTPNPLPRRTAGLPRDHSLRALLARAGVSSVVRFPLHAGGEFVGSIILLDLLDLDRIDSASEVISLLSSPIAFALKNALAHKRAEAELDRIREE